MNALFRWVPPFVLARLRTLALRMAGVKIGAKTIFWDVPTIVGARPVLQHLRIGTSSGFNKGCYFDLEADVIIGDHVAVGHDVAFLTGGYEVGPPGQRAGRRTGAPISVGDGVWLGARCVILAGVTIGAGSVVGAGMVVGQDVPENTLVAGPRPVSIARWR